MTSPSQSSQIDSTCCTSPDVAPLCQCDRRERDGRASGRSRSSPAMPVHPSRPFIKNVSVLRILNDLPGSALRHPTSETRSRGVVRWNSARRSHPDGPWIEAHSTASSLPGHAPANQSEGAACSPVEMIGTCRKLNGATRAMTQSGAYQVRRGDRIVWSLEMIEGEFRYVARSIARVGTEPAAQSRRVGSVSSGSPS